MKKVLKVDGRWTIPLPEADPHDVWFMDWVLRSPTVLGRHMAAGLHALRDIQARGVKPDTVVELFGGVGAQALMAQDLFAPAKHDVVEISKQGVIHLRELLGDKATVHQADAYEFDLSAYRPGALFVLDFGDLTIRWLEDGSAPRKILDQVAKLDPAAVVITDIAGPYLHLQRPRYEALVGQKLPDHPTYLHAFAQRLEGILPGLSHVSTAYHHGTAVLGFVPGATGPVEPVRIADSILKVETHDYTLDDVL